ncbi:MAG: metallophosphoesterase family protein [Acidobacteriaceae bacterium]
MKVAIISDIHANLAALEAFPEPDCDRILCLGDLVDYGPSPKEVIRWIREHGVVCVRGNHDQAAGYQTDPHCSIPFVRLAAATLRYTLDVLSSAESQYLQRLPIQGELTIEKTRFYLVHATPSDPLYGYRAASSERWTEEVEWVDADVILTGHTHIPFARQIGAKQLVNPGSLGQPKTGNPEACYVVWHDGTVTLKRYAYPVESTVSAIRAMPVSPGIQEELIYLLRTGAPTPQPRATSAK